MRFYKRGPWILENLEWVLENLEEVQMFFTLIFSYEFTSVND